MPYVRVSVKHNLSVLSVIDIEAYNRYKTHLQQISTWIAKRIIYTYQVSRQIAVS